MAILTTLSLSYSALLLLLTLSAETKAFSIKEATITGINHAFKHNQLTSRQLVEFYLKEIRKLNPILNAVIEVNPDALRQADKADQERKSGSSKTKNGLHGIPVLLKDNIATKDKLNTTAGSFALLGSIVPRDARVARRLRIAGAIILGKASLTEWSAFRSSNVPNGWNARAGQSRNPYVLSVTPCGSSSGSAITVATNMVTVAVGSETDGSIICPSTLNSVVGIKPTVGLTSRAGVVPISPRQDTIGPICRTVADAVYVLDAIVGYDKGDAKATSLASKFIPAGGYKAFLKADGLKGKRLGIVRNPFFTSLKGTLELQVFNRHFKTLRKNGAIVVDNLEIANLSTVVDSDLSGENTTMLAEFKQALNAYLRDLVRTPVRTLKDIIVFNSANKKEMVSEFGQDIMVDAEKTNGIGHKEKEALLNMNKLSKNGLEKLMSDHKLDAIVTPDYDASAVFAIGGYPAITVPAGYRQGGVPFGIYFGGLRGSEPKLIEIAYAFEQATKIRRPPSFRP